jgi:hypothetical protein
MACILLLLLLRHTPGDDNGDAFAPAFPFSLRSDVRVHLLLGMVPD